MENIDGQENVEQLDLIKQLVAIQQEQTKSLENLVCAMYSYMNDLRDIRQKLDDIDSHLEEIHKDIPASNKTIGNKNNSYYI